MSALVVLLLALLILWRMSSCSRLVTPPRRFLQLVHKTTNYQSCLHKHKYHCWLLIIACFADACSAIRWLQIPVLVRYCAIVVGCLHLRDFLTFESCLNLESLKYGRIRHVRCCEQMQHQHEIDMMIVLIDSKGCKDASWIDDNRPKTLTIK